MLLRFSRRLHPASVIYFATIRSTGTIRTHSTFASITRSVPRIAFFGFFSYGNVNDRKPDPFPGIAGGGSFTGNINNKALMAGLSDVHAFSANRINELKSRLYPLPGRCRNPSLQGSRLRLNWGFPESMIRITPSRAACPNIQISGLNSLGNGDWFPEILHENNYQLVDSFTYIHGRHSFKMGGDLRRRRARFLSSPEFPRRPLTTPANSPMNPWPTFSSVTRRVFSATRRPGLTACAGGSSAPI